MSDDKVDKVVDAVADATKAGVRRAMGLLPQDEIADTVKESMKAGADVAGKAIDTAADVGAKAIDAGAKLADKAMSWFKK